MTDIFDYLRLAFINYLHINYQKIVDFSKSPNRRAKNNIFSMLPFIFNYSTIIRTPHFYIKHKPASHERSKTKLYYTISFQFAKHTNYQMEIQLDSVHWSIKFCLFCCEPFLAIIGYFGYYKAIFVKQFLNMQKRRNKIFKHLKTSILPFTAICSTSDDLAFASYVAMLNNAPAK